MLWSKLSQVYSLRTYLLVLLTNGLMDGLMLCDVCRAGARSDAVDVLGVRAVAIVKRPTPIA